MVHREQARQPYGEEVSPLLLTAVRLTFFISRALAQKIVIRLGQQFPTGKLVELNANSMLSKWFGESGKLISKAFDEIHAMAQVKTSLICVLLDEVETLAGSRDVSMAGSDCRDGLRVRSANNRWRLHH